jgi:hypothetical protein
MASVVNYRCNNLRGRKMSTEEFKANLRIIKDKSFGVVKFHGRTLSPHEHDLWCEGFDTLALMLIEAMEAIEKSVERSDAYGDSYCSKPIRQAKADIESQLAKLGGAE